MLANKTSVRQTAGKASSRAQAAIPHLISSRVEVRASGVVPFSGVNVKVRDN